MKSTKTKFWNSAISLLNCRGNWINNKQSTRDLLVIRGKCREISVLRHCNYKIRIKYLQHPLGHPRTPIVKAMMVAERIKGWSFKTSIFALQWKSLKKMNVFFGNRYDIKWKYCVGTNQYGDTWRKLGPSKWDYMTIN